MHKEAEFLQKLLPGYYMVCITQNHGPDWGLLWQLFWPERHTGHVLRLCQGQREQHVTKPDPESQILPIICKLCG